MSAVSSSPPVQVVYSEMVEADRSLVLELVSAALRSVEKSERMVYHRDLAQMVKLELDTAKGGKWNVIVGKSFGSFVTHETKTYSAIASSLLLLLGVA